MRRNCKRCGTPSEKMEYPQRFVCRKCMTVNESPEPIVIEPMRKDLFEEEEIEVWDEEDDTIIMEDEDDTEDPEDPEDE